MKKRKLSPRALKGLVAGGVLLYLVAGFFLLVSPKRSEAAQLEGRVAEAETQLALARVAAARQAPEAEKIATADLFRLAKAMPAATDMPGILLELSDIAADTGIVFESIAPSPSSVGVGYQIVPVNVSFTGNFYELSDFLFRLRTLVGVRGGELDARGRLFSIQKLAFGEAPGKFPDIQAELVVNAYVYGTDVPASDVAPPVAPEPGADSGTTVPPAAPAGAEVSAAGELP